MNINYLQLFYIVSIISVIILLVILVILFKIDAKNRKEALERKNIKTTLLESSNDIVHNEVIVINEIDENKVESSSDSINEIDENKVENSSDSIGEITLNEENNSLVEERKVLPNVKTRMYVHYRKSMKAKLILTPELQEAYMTIKNYLLSFKNVRSRLSFKAERFSVGRKTLVRMMVRGKRLYVYYALNPLEQLEKYHLLDVSSKKIGEELPSLLRVKSNRSVVYAKQLVDILMDNNDVVRLTDNKIVVPDYKYLEKRTFEELLMDGEIVKYLSKTSTSIDLLEDETDNSISYVTAETVDNLVDDCVLEEKVVRIVSNNSGAMQIINVDILEKNFADGAIINLKTLIEARLVPAKTKRIKILARGKLSKSFDVTANYFSKEAMKMIIYMNGKVKVLS